MGRAFTYGDNVDTDVIIPARYLTTTDVSELARHALEDLDPGFVAAVRPGDVVVAGENFGCGSSREHAPLAIKGSGVSAVVASSFSRIFFRNAINTGLPIAVCAAAVAATDAGDEIEVDIEGSVVRNTTKDLTFDSDPLPEFVMDIVRSGGLVNWIRDHHGATA